MATTNSKHFHYQIQICMRWLLRRVGTRVHKEKPLAIREESQE